MRARCKRSEGLQIYICITKSTHLTFDGMTRLIGANKMKWHDPFNRCKKKRFNPRAGKKWPMMPRQKIILEYYKDGFTSQRITEKMGITRQTLYSHLKRIYYKLDVHNIKDAIEKGLR
jgi:DNA-binding CsgD family transcriptional regulator